MRLRRTSLIVLALWGMSTTAGAQAGDHTHIFKPLPEATIEGVVERVDDDGREACPACQACLDCTGTHLVLRKGAARIEVHLAPAWFLERSGFDFAPGDVVLVTGTPITIRRVRAVVAREVRRGTVVMTFRDEHGLPLWRRELTEQ